MESSYHPSPNVDKSAKINIKRMCQKFERLNSAEDDTSLSCTNSIVIHKQDSHEEKPLTICDRIMPPKAPVRKARNRNSMKKDIQNTDNISTADVCVVNNDGVKSDQLSPCMITSVRERTKFFEHAGNSNTKNQETVGEDHVEKVKLRKKMEETPPVKPPRTSYITPSKKSENILKNKSNGFLSTKNEPSNFKLQRSKNQNCSLQPEVIRGKKESPNCALWDSTKSTPEVSAKPLAISNYLKRISNCAVQFQEKAKMKAGDVFIDLTPTTVSPPKHYGTLKRSHSEEHIYAEPFEADAEEISLQDQSSNELHYMCTPIFDSTDLKPTQRKRNLPLTDKSRREPTIKKSAVRRVIYESFSMLRRPQRFEGQTLSDKDGDSESDVSLKDVQERTIYVKSVKKQISVSSLCTAPKLFEAILFINIANSGPEVIHKYPQTLKKMFDYPLIPQLCFPDYKCLEVATVYRSEMFHFTLTGADDEKIFGYCHRILGWPEQSGGFCHKFPLAICILSAISAPLFYKKVLVEIEKHIMLPIEECSQYLASLRKLGVPNAGASVSIPDNTENIPRRMIVTRPLDSHQIGIELTRSLQLLDVHIMMKVVSSLLLERRVLFLSHNSWNVLHCVSAMSSLLYPFQWQHLLIPIVPSCLKVQCCSESPYLLGIVCTDFSSILDLLSEHELLIVDVDKGSILKSFGDEDTILPKKIHKAVIGAFNLAKNMTDPTEMMRDVMISEAAIHMFVEMVGHVTNHIVTQPKVAFQKEAFQKNAPSRSIHSFLQWFSETQMFEAFIDEFIWRMNYREICQSQQFTLFEKRLEEYKWELAYDNDKISKKIGKTVKNIGEKLKNFTKELL